MSKVIAIIAVSIIHLAASQYVFSQITINLRKLPKIDKPKTDTGKTAVGVQDQNTTTADGKLGQPKNPDGKNIYPAQRPTGTPVLLKNSVYVQATTHNEYWKMLSQRNYSSWVPSLRFSHFFNNEKNLNYMVEYFNPDGSPWYSEKLEQSSRIAGDRTVLFQSPSPWAGILDTKSTAATGVFSFKITDQDSNEVLYKGKFKVGKFSTANGSPDKNKFQFFVDHDWLMPFGMIGFHHSLDHVGAMPLLVSVWLKGDVSASELEGRIFYKGQQIVSTKDGGGAGDYDERTTDMAAAFSPLSRWKRWEFQWRNFLFDNNGTFNRDNFPNAHYADKNPGDYTVKVYRGGTQIRELSFTIGADGKYVVPAYTGQLFMPYHRIILPVKIMGTEKWDSASWKTDSFYGNLLTGFDVK
ncbi:MAG: hypothetical protein ACRD6X_20000 [Pyrinomonadaceae bacterium]